MTLRLRHGALAIFFFLFCIQDIYGQPSVEGDEFFSALGQELEFYEADWLENNSTIRDISIGAKWFTESEQETYLGQVIYSDKKLIRKLDKKGHDKDDIAVLFVVLTNNSKYRILFDGSAANIVDSKNRITKRSRIEQVIKKFNYKYSRGGKAFVKIATLGFGGTKGFDEMRLGSIRSNLFSKWLTKSIVEPGESSTGLLFIPASSIRDDSVIEIPIQNLKRLLYLDFKLNFPKTIE